MDILLTHGYFLDEDPAERQVMKPYPPLGLLYLSSHLKSVGYDVEILDTTFSRREKFDDYVDSHRPGIVGIYTTLMTRKNVVHQIRKLKAVGSTVILGGPEPVNYAKEYLDRGADIIVAGEGEQTLEELIPILTKGGKNGLETIAGIAYRNDGGTTIRTPPRPLIKPLDQQPFPDRSAIDLNRYLQTWKTHHGVSSVSLITARGCPYRCNWCSHSVFGFSYRHRSPQNVADEIELIRDQYNPDQIWYADDVFTMNHHWLYEYAQELKRRNLHYPFETISREDRLKEEVVSTLSGMGCYRLWVGAESGSQRILDAMERRTDAVRMREMIKLLKHHGIRSGTFIMLGYDGETWEDIDATTAHLKAVPPDDVLVTLAYPIKGTEFYDKLGDRIVPLQDWEQGSDRDLTFRGRRSRTFYRHAQNWIMNELSAQRFLDAKTRDAKRLCWALLRAKSHRIGMYLTRHQMEDG